MKITIYGWSTRLHHWLQPGGVTESLRRTCSCVETGFMTAAEVIAAFARAWNTDNDNERLELLTAACLPDTVFVAPQGQTSGVESLSASIAEFRRAFPAATVGFGVPDGHGGFARVAWTTTWNNGQAPLTGEDFAQLAEDGRIRLLVSFDGAATISK